MITELAYAGTPGLSKGAALKIAVLQELMQESIAENYL